MFGIPRRLIRVLMMGPMAGAHIPELLGIVRYKPTKREWRDVHRIVQICKLKSRI
jgi:hypothetical protein